MFVRVTTLEYGFYQRTHNTVTEYMYSVSIVLKAKADSIVEFRNMLLNSEKSHIVEITCDRFGDMV